MKTVIVGNLNIRKEPLVSLSFPYDETMKQLIKTVPGAEWRSAHRNIKQAKGKKTGLSRFQTKS